jgi:glucosylglycerate synthase
MTAGPAGGATAATEIAADVLVCVPSGSTRESLVPLATQMRARSAPVIFAHPDVTEDTTLADGTRVVGYSGAPAVAEANVLPWTTQPESLESVAAVARRLGVKGCVLLGPDYSGMRGDDVVALALPLLEQNRELVMPVYRARPMDGLLNTAVLYPLVRALYGKRVRYPVAAEFAATAALLVRAVKGAAPGRGQARVAFAATEAAAMNLPLSQAQISLRRGQQAGSTDLSGILEQIAGPLFSDMEVKAPLWQRVRESQDAGELRAGSGGYGSATEAGDESDAVDVAGMVEQFRLGERNLGDVWGLVLPPVTLLGLKRLARTDAETFLMPDELWAKVVYDFALANRTRAMARQHLFGAMAPLYLGWVAGYAREVAELHGRSPAEQRDWAEKRVEALALTFEREKPYLLQRWRWPDRFNP